MFKQLLIVVSMFGSVAFAAKDSKTSGQTQNAIHYCSTCKAMFKTEAAFKAHDHFVARPVRKDPRVNSSNYCYACDEIFADRREVENHAQLHTSLLAGDRSMASRTCEYAVIGLSCAIGLFFSFVGWAARSASAQ